MRENDIFLLVVDILQNTFLMPKIESWFNVDNDEIHLRHKISNFFLFGKPT